MGNPKKKWTKARRNKRAAHWKLERPNLGECPHCHQPKLPHRVCSNCGYYKGREAVPASAR